MTDTQFPVVADAVETLKSVHNRMQARAAENQHWADVLSKAGNELEAENYHKLFREYNSLALQVDSAIRGLSNYLR